MVTSNFMRVLKGLGNYQDLEIIQFSSSQNCFLRLTPTSQDRFALRQLLSPDYSTTNLVLLSLTSQKI